jgi:hypothetical protein
MNGNKEWKRWPGNEARGANGFIYIIIIYIISLASRRLPRGFAESLNNTRRTPLRDQYLEAQQTSAEPLLYTRTNLTIWSYCFFHLNLWYGRDIMKAPISACGRFGRRHGEQGALIGPRLAGRIRNARGMAHDKDARATCGPLEYSCLRTLHCPSIIRTARLRTYVPTYLRTFNASQELSVHVHPSADLPLVQNHRLQPYY